MIFISCPICRAYCSSSNLTLTTCNLSNQERVLIYGGIIAGMFVLNIARAVLFYIVLLRAAHILHINRMFQKLLRAPVLFFDSNPVGTSSLSFDERIISVINLMYYWDNHYHSQGVRFTNDTDFMDNMLPFVFLDFSQVLKHLNYCMYTYKVGWFLQMVQINFVHRF